jgi:hypothetical protein
MRKRLAVENDAAALRETSRVLLSIPYERLYNQRQFGLSRARRQLLRAEADQCVILVTNVRELVRDQWLAGRIASSTHRSTTMTEDTLKAVEQAVDGKRELASDELDAISGGAVAISLHMPNDIRRLNPQPLPPG